MTAALRVVAGTEIGEPAFSPGQEAAAKAFRDWMRSGAPGQVFRLFGYAGTGKTTVTRRIVQGVRGGPAYVAPTGKAAMRMRETGCEGASTIHSAIYRAPGEDEGGPQFQLDPKAKIAKAGIIVCDEASMVDEEVGRDLLSFGIPVLALGDPAQLPPVKGPGYLTAQQPDAMLTEVHRQALDNPILALATRIRQGGKLELGEWGPLRVVRRGTLSASEVADFDQVLVGTHKMRKAFIRQLRRHRGHVGIYPEPGERLMCTSNDRKLGIFNGQMFSCVSSRSTAQCVMLRVLPLDDDDAMTMEVRTLQEPWREIVGMGEPGWKPTPQERAMNQWFDFGDVITVHKAQGSEWSNVLVYDGAWGSAEDRARWRYTAITRAADRLTVVL